MIRGTITQGACTPVRLAIVVCALLSVAAAERPVDSAKTYFQAGQQAYQAGFYLDAARAFEQAYDIVANPAITFSLGQTYRRQFLLDGDAQHLKRAILAYRRYLQNASRAARRADAIEHLGQLEQRRLAMGLAPVEAANAPAPEPRKTQLMVTSQTEGAQALVDDAAPQQVPVVVEVEPGQHRVQVSADGHFPQSVSAIAIEGRLVVAQVDLDPRPAKLRLTGPKGAAVALDGRQIGKLPFEQALELAAGAHRIRTTQDGKHAFVSRFDLARGEARSLVAKMPTTSQRKMSYWFIGGGTTLLVASGVLVAVALASEGQARLILITRDTLMENLSQEDLETYISARDRRNDLLTISTVTMVGTLVVGGIGAALYFLDSGEPMYRDTGLTPFWSPTGAFGLNWASSF